MQSFQCCTSHYFQFSSNFKGHFSADLVPLFLITSCFPPDYVYLFIFFVNLILLAQKQGQVASCCESGNEISGSLYSGNFLTSCINISFSTSILPLGVAWLEISVFLRHFIATLNSRGRGSGLRSDLPGKSLFANAPPLCNEGHWN